MKNQYIIPEIEIAVISRSFASEYDFEDGEDISLLQNPAAGNPNAF